MTDVLINQFEWLADNFIHTFIEKLVTTFRIGELTDGFQRVVIVLHMEILFRNVNPNGAEVKMELELHPSDELCEHEAAKWLPLDDLRQVNWLPADVLVVEEIQRTV